MMCEFQSWRVVWVSWRRHSFRCRVSHVVYCRGIIGLAGDTRVFRAYGMSGRGRLHQAGAVTTGGMRGVCEGVSSMRAQANDLMSSLDRDTLFVKGSAIRVEMSKPRPSDA